MSAAAFIPAPGANFAAGDEREIARRLGALAAYIGKPIYGISGARTPAHSVAVGGAADDPHTRGQAADIGVGNALRTSAASVPEPLLRKFGLYRPFAGAAEINHVQLLPGFAGKTPTRGGDGGSVLDTLGDAASWLVKPPQLNDPSLPVHVGLPDLTDPITKAAEAGAQAAAAGAWSALRPKVVPFMLKATFIIGGAALLVYGLAVMTGQQDRLRATGARAAGAAKMAAAAGGA